MKKIIASIESMLNRFSHSLLGDDGTPVVRKRWPTGVHRVDEALGGGLPQGCVIEVFGRDDQPTLSHVLRLLGHIQRAGARAAIVDAECSIDAQHAQQCGVALDQLLVLRPPHGEAALQMADRLACEGTRLVVVNSVAALVPKAELTFAIGEAPAGLVGRMMSQGLRRLLRTAQQTGTTFVFVNQMRRAVADDGHAFWTTPGGNALHYYAAVRLEITKGDVIIHKGHEEATQAPAPIDAPGATPADLQMKKPPTHLA